MPLTNGEYAIFALVTLLIVPCLALCTSVFATVLGPVGCLFWFPLVLFMAIPALVARLMFPVLRLFGREPAGGSSDETVALAVVIWPLTLAPAHFLNFRVLGWPEWGFTILMGASMVLVAAGVVGWHSRRVRCG